MMIHYIKICLSVYQKPTTFSLLWDTVATHIFVEGHRQKLIML